MANRILLTGAAGIVGTALRPLLRARYQQVLLADLRSPEALSSNETFASCDIADLHAFQRLTSDVDGIVHLAGMVGADYGFDEVLGPNIVGTQNVYRAAFEAGIANVVYASSHHVVGFVKRGAHIDHQTAHRPDSAYGLSKAFGESAGAYFADKFGLNVLAIRIGFVGPEVTDERRLHTWISARDLCQLIQIGLENKDLGYEVVYGVSDNPDPFFDNTNATRLGYRPQDRALEHLKDPHLLSSPPAKDTIGGACVGGGFAAVGYQGNHERTLRG